MQHVKGLPLDKTCSSLQLAVGKELKVGLVGYVTLSKLTAVQLCGQQEEEGSGLCDWKLSPASLATLGRRLQ